MKRRDADGALARQLRALGPGADGDRDPQGSSPGAHASASLNQTSAQRKEGAAATAEQEGARWREWLLKWYRQPLFGDLSQSPAFPALLQRREEGDPHTMADVLEGCSPGRMPSAWGLVEEARIPVLFAHGSRDSKFAAIGQQVEARAGALREAAKPPDDAGGDLVKVVAIEGAAHAVLEEAPAACGEAVAGFLQSVLSVSGTASRRPAHCPAGIEPVMIASANVRSFNLRLKEPLHLSSGDPISVRKGSLLEVSTMSGHVGVGECTPLPGFHKESYAQAHAQLLVVADVLQGRLLQPDLELLTEGALASWLVSQHRSRPSQCPTL